MFYALLGLSLTACGGDKAGSKAVPPPTEAPPPAKLADATTPLAAKDAAPPLAPATAPSVEALFDAEGLEPGPALAERWAEHAKVDAFLGFSKDGRSYAVATKLGHEDEPGYWGFWVRFIEIRDVHTGRPIAVYQGEKRRRISKEDRDNGAAPEDELESEAYAFMKTLPSYEDANKVLDSLGMSGNAASRQGPSGLGLEAELQGKAPGASRFQLKPRKKGVDFIWSRLGSDSPKSARRSPRISLAASKGGETYPLLSFRSKFKDADIIDQFNGDPLTLKGRVTSFWSQDGRRVALTLFEELLGAHEEMGFIGRYDYYLRSVGPQIKLVDAGAGLELSRKAALLLEHWGMTVTSVEADEVQVDGIQLYYRGPAGKAVCDELRTHLPEAKVEAMDSEGWVDVIVMMGSGA